MMQMTGHLRPVSAVCRFMTIVISVGGTLGLPTGSSRQQESHAGGNVTIHCQTSTNADVDWMYKSDAAASESYVYANGVISASFRSRFTVDRPTEGDYNLVIVDVQQGDAGLYICVEDGGYGPIHQVKLIINGDPSDLPTAATSTTLVVVIVVVVITVVVALVFFIIVICHQKRRNSRHTNEGPEMTPLADMSNSLHVDAAAANADSADDPNEKVNDVHKQSKWMCGCANWCCLHTNIPTPEPPRTKTVSMYRSAVEPFCRLIDEFGNAINQLKMIVDKLEEIRLTVLKARAGLAVAGIASGATAVGAGIACVVTAGLTAPIAVAAASGTVAAATGVSAMCVRAIGKMRENDQMKEGERIIKSADKIWKESIDILGKVESSDTLNAKEALIVREMLHELNEDTEVETHVGQTPRKMGGANLVSAGADAFAAGAAGAARGVQSAAKLATGAACAGKVISSAGVVFGVVGVGVDIWQLVDASLELAKKDVPEAIKKIQKIADCLDEKVSTLTAVKDRAQELLDTQALEGTC